MLLTKRNWKLKAAPKKTGNECAVNETELEIKSGTKEDLLAYAGQIANLVPVTPGNRSKYERGMKLCGINLTRNAK